MQTSLFDLQGIKPASKCKHCMHLFALNYVNKRFFYCDMQRCSLTLTKRKKINYNDNSCKFFSPI